MYNNYLIVSLLHVATCVHVLGTVHPVISQPKDLADGKGSSDDTHRYLSLESEMVSIDKYS